MLLNVKFKKHYISDKSMKNCLWGKMYQGFVHPFKCVRLFQSSHALKPRHLMARTLPPVIA